MQHELLADLGKSVLAAAALGFIVNRFRIPLLLAYLIAGVLLGPHLGLGLVQSAESISTLSELGLVLLMFILGLEIDVRKLLQAGRTVLVNGVTQFLGCFGLGLFFFGALKFGHGFGEYGVLYLATACALSSTLIAVKILSDRLELDSLTSRLTLGILVIQDLWAIGFLAVQPNLDHLSGGAVLISAAKAAVLVGLSWFCARFLLPKLFAIVGKQPELMLITAMAWCFGICGVAAQLQLSLEMGALVAGVSIASFPYHADVAAKISSLRDFFITLFFVSLGLQIPKPTGDVLTLTLAISGFVMVSRFLTVFPVLYLMQYGDRASFLPALNLSQLSEFSLVLAALGQSYGHVRPELLSAFILALVLTALCSSFLIPNGHAVYKQMAPWFHRLGIRNRIGEQESDAADENVKPPEVVLLGFYREASSLLYEMTHRYSEYTMDRVLVVDFNPEAHHKLTDLGVSCRYGDISSMDTLRKLDLNRAKLLVCTIPDSGLKGTTNLKLLQLLKGLAPDAMVIVSADHVDIALQMYEQGADYVYLPRMVGSHYLADVMERLQSDGSKVLRQKAKAHLTGRNEVLA